MNNQHVPLCVDLDGTLIYSDILYESLVRALKTSPWIIFMLPLWLLKGKAFLKQQLADRSNIDVTKLPYNTELLDFLKTQHGLNRTLILVTASNKKFAEQIATHLGIFSRTLASDHRTNLKSTRKAEILSKEFGEKNFDYAGNETADYAVWEKSNQAIVVNARNSVIQQAQKISPAPQILSTRTLSLYRYIKTIRIYQWIKNTLLFVPLISSQHLFDPNAVSQVIIGFFAFSLSASFAYIINDLSDLDADRSHPNKMHRPFAAGTVAIKHGLMLAAGLIFGTLILCNALPPSFGGIILIYFLATFTYSLYLKTIPMLDVFTLAGLYTLRVIAGAFAIDVQISFWLLAFSIFIFLSLAIVKRTSELITLQIQNIGHLKGRDYSTQDISIINSFGVASGYAAVVVLALYINSDSVIGVFRHPKLLWLFCPMLLYWISRIWFRTNRGEIIGDPILAALRDRHTQCLTMIAIALLLTNFLM